MTTVKSLSREDFEVERFSHRNVQYRDYYIETSKLWAKFFPLMELIGNICVVLLLGYGGYLVMNDDLSLGGLVAFFSLVWYILDSWTSLCFIIKMCKQAKEKGKR